MGKSRAPTPPSPTQTAGAQTAENIGTATANAYLGNVNQVTPFGSLTYDQTGTHTVTGPDGELHEVPTFTATQTLSPDQQQIANSMTWANQNLAELAGNRAWAMNDYLRQDIDTSTLPQGGSADNLVDRAQRQTVGAPERAMHQINDAGNIQRGTSWHTQGLNDSVDGQQMQTGFADVGGPTRSYGGDYSADRQRVEDAVMSRVQPQLDRDREALRTQLVNQGIREGSEAYDRAMERADQQSVDARMQAVLAGGQEQSRLDDMTARRAGFENSAQAQAYGQAQGRAAFGNQARQDQMSADVMQAGFGNQTAAQRFGQELQGRQFANQAQNQQFTQNAVSRDTANAAAAQNNAADMAAAGFNNDVIGQNMNERMAIEGRRDADRTAALNETFALRNQPINEISALLGTGQLQTPQFVPTASPSIPTTNTAGLTMDAYNQQMQAYQTQNANRQSMLGGLLGLGGSLGAAAISDRRMKRDIRLVGESGGLNVYEYRYEWDDTRRRGFMADEVAQVRPDAVIQFGATMALDYAQLPEAA